jgi:hypothetical protein
LQEKLSSAIEANVVLVLQRDEDAKSASLMRSESIGLNTLVCLYLLEADSVDIDTERVAKIVKQKLLPIPGLIKEHHNVDSGAAGYLTALMLVRRKIKEKMPAEYECTNELLTLLKEAI